MLQFDWFLQGHEHRNDYIRFGLMKRHLAGELVLRVHPLAESAAFGFQPRGESADFRHTSLFCVTRGQNRLRVFIDNEDGFTHLCPLVEEVDLYFCCPYNRRFHVDRQFIEPYPWQTEEDVRWHREQAERVLHRFSAEQFRKILPLGPTISELTLRGAKTPGRLAQKLANAGDKVRRMVRKVAPSLGGEPWMSEYRRFAQRYDQMLSYRKLSLEKDVVSREALWRDGWPRHRVALHEQLHALKGRWNIRGQLTEADGWAEWSPAAKERLGKPMQLDRGFEDEILSSRLPVFPTGAHWGWRGIVFLTLCAGSRCLIDRPMYEPYFSFDEFDCVYNPGDWSGIEPLLTATTDSEWLAARRRNQAVFDRRMTPEAYTSYLIGELNKRL